MTGGGCYRVVLVRVDGVLLRVSCVLFVFFLCSFCVVCGGCVVGVVVVLCFVVCFVVVVNFICDYVVCYCRVFLLGWGVVGAGCSFYNFVSPIFFFNFCFEGDCFFLFFFVS